jgi:PiT family inorganic phosphate transporter
MSDIHNKILSKASKRYVNDLKRFNFSYGAVNSTRSMIMPFAIAAMFLVVAGVIGNMSLNVTTEDWAILIAASIIGGYMALNIGANDVANNMGPAVGGKVLSVVGAVAIAAIFESAGALLAGGDVVKTVAKGIITPGETISIDMFRNLMLSALLAAALWINLATYLNAPVSTTHSIVGGVMGAGIMASGFGVVNWVTMTKIGASWIISPVFGGIVSAMFLYLIKVKVLNVRERNAAARKWVPILIGVMAGAFCAYMSIKGLKKIWKPEIETTLIASVTAAIIFWLISIRYVSNQANKIGDRKKEIYSLFNLPLVMGVSLLCFAHGANDVANAVGPLAAIVSTFGDQTVSAKVGIPFWVMAIGATGIAVGLLLFGPKLIHTVGEKITRLNAPRAYCVAIASAITVLIATTLGLPVSSTHIAIGAIFGIGFLREFMENPNKKRLRPAHRINSTAADAFRNIDARIKRKLVRRKFVVSIATAWIITVPSSAILAGSIFYVLQLLGPMVK